ncbi:Tlp-20 [Helicoverpa armigera multiple nucleopolyhedrovirus]|uniref:Tlp-20 n=1 Tax=Mamestra brassicae nuclear polyhedrosis virus TaxID=78219 RepID=A0A077D2V6_NPVMB|nr:Tlp-20 [Helicoverpa armigera multiple nucleopolyhedrovirus]AIL25172.1 tlp-20 [Mamestra brassicae multiple nucleopolyhedrovirus]
MATNNSNTVDISVHVTLDKEANKNILSFIVREEYHLKKLAVGAYSLNILDTQLLNDLAQRAGTTVACGDYVICYNFTENSNKINVILFNIKPTVLKKGGCIFKIVYDDKSPTNVNNNKNIVTSDKMLVEPLKDLNSQHADSQHSHTAYVPESDGSSSSSSSSSSDTDDNDTDTNELSEPVPIKRQKLDQSDPGQV